MKNSFTALLVIGLVIGFSSCKDQPKKQEPQKPVTKVVQKPLKDSLAIDSLQNLAKKEEVKEVEPPKPEDKYFLIAGSFQSRTNAEIFKSRLESEGYQSSIIERRNGPNNEFFKVSYMSFYDRKMAYAELRKARKSEGRDNVWLLVKR